MRQEPVLDELSPAGAKLELIHFEPPHQRGVRVVTQAIDIAHAHQEKVKRPTGVITPGEIIFPHQPVIDPTELGRNFPESFRIEDTFFHGTFHS